MSEEEKKRISEGDKLKWTGACKDITGIVVKEENEMIVYVEGSRSFRLVDLLSSPSLEKIGKVKLR